MIASARTSHGSKMDAPVRDRLAPARLLQPDIRLIGEISNDLYQRFRDQFDAAKDQTELVLELTTLGGDAEIGRRIASDIKVARSICNQDFWFVGRTAVYSAGVTIMAAFPISRRVLGPDAALLIHERKLDETLRLEGALSACLSKLEQTKAEIEIGMMLQREGFAELAAGSSISVDEIAQRARNNWYLRAHEAL